MERNKERELQVRMMPGLKGKSREEISRLENSQLLKITNLKHGITEEQIADHIEKHPNVTARFVEVRRHFQRHVPSFALVEIGGLENTKRVINTLQMSLLEGQKMWIQQHEGLCIERNTNFKGHTTNMLLRHLPFDIDGTSKIKKLSAVYGKVASVKLLTDELG